jgi:hypothetical protein
MSQPSASVKKIEDYRLAACGCLIKVRTESFCTVAERNVPICSEAANIAPRGSWSTRQITVGAPYLNIM